jgi:hypothetical protein
MIFTYICMAQSFGDPNHGIAGEFLLSPGAPDRSPNVLAMRATRSAALPLPPWADYDPPISPMVFCLPSGKLT